MKKTSSKGSVLIYTLILVSLSLIMAVVVLNNSSRLSLNFYLVNTQNKLSRVISDNARIIFKLAKQLNSNGGGFVDNLRCPDTLSMSGTTTMSGTVSTSLYVNGVDIYCLGTYNNGGGDKALKIYFSSGITDLEVAEYDGSLVSLENQGVGRKGTLSFTDADLTMIDFSLYNHRLSDDFDDNIDSDNYRVTSTGGIYYPDDYEDDDTLHRKVKFGYIGPGTGFNSILWNNSKTNKLIDQNVNNNDILNVKAGTSTGAYLYLDIDQNYSMFLYRLNRDKFNQIGELEALQKLKGENQGAGVGYIQDNGGTLSLSGTIGGGITGNEYVFDFKNNDYALLLENVTGTVLSYNVRGFNSVSGSGVYIVPVDDSDDILLKYLGNTIIIDDKSRLVYEQKEIISSK